MWKISRLAEGPVILQDRPVLHGVHKLAGCGCGCGRILERHIFHSRALRNIYCYVANHHMHTYKAYFISAFVGLLNKCV